MNLQLPHLLRCGLCGLFLAAAMTAGCSEANVRTDAALPVAPMDRSNPAADTPFFFSSGLARPYMVYGQSNEKYKNDRVAPGGTQVAAAPSVAPIKAAAQVPASSIDQPPMTMKVMAAAPPPPPIVGGGAVAYQPIIGTIPVGDMVDVQAWVSSDLRYVNINLHYTHTGPVTFTRVGIGAAP